MGILEKLWAEGLHPAETACRHSKEHIRAVRRWSESERALTEGLGEGQRERYEKAMSDYSVLVSSSECDSFMTGFRLGAELMIDVFCDEDM